MVVEPEEALPPPLRESGRLGDGGDGCPRHDVRLRLAFSGDLRGRTWSMRGKGDKTKENLTINLIQISPILRHAFP